jgi:hypothetical protein
MYWRRLCQPPYHHFSSILRSIYRSNGVIFRAGTVPPGIPRTCIDQFNCGHFNCGINRQRTLHIQPTFNPYINIRLQGITELKVKQVVNTFRGSELIKVVTSHWTLTHPSGAVIDRQTMTPMFNDLRCSDLPNVKWYKLTQIRGWHHVCVFLRLLDVSGLYAVP